MAVAAVDIGAEGMTGFDLSPCPRFQLPGGLRPPAVRCVAAATATEHAVPPRATVPWAELDWGCAVKLESIRIRNFRAIDRLELRPHPQVTVLHGDNAHGKTSVLSAIAAGLGAIPTALGVAGLRLKKADRRDGSEYTRVFLKTTDEVAWEQRLGKRLDWQEEPNREHLPAGPLRGLKNWLNETDSIGGPPADLPIVAYYDTDRAVVDAIRPDAKRKAGTNRHLALAGALAAKTSFRELFEWFYEKENEELREQKELPSHQLTDLSAVRDAITSMVEGVSEPRVKMRPMRFVVSERVGERTEDRSLGELSGGCRAVLALAGDLARRMAQGNPHLANPLLSEAVVLIDEVDLHLHPSWQQRILRDLTRTFPNAQFIVSTHSPQVLTTVMPEQVVRIASGERCSPGQSHVCDNVRCRGRQRACGRNGRAGKARQRLHGQAPRVYAPCWTREWPDKGRNRSSESIGRTVPSRPSSRSCRHGDGEAGRGRRAELMKRIKAMVEPTPGLSSYLDEATSPGYGEFRDYREGAAYREAHRRIGQSSARTVRILRDRHLPASIELSNRACGASKRPTRGGIASHQHDRLLQRPVPSSRKMKNGFSSRRDGI